MIARLRGKVFQKQVDRLILDVNGVGYDVQISLNTYNALPEEGDATLHIQTRIREDAFDLIGFSSLEERDIFRLLVGVSGIGPRMALTTLSGITPADFVDTIRRENLARLTAVPGIGKKTAERIVVELRDKVKDMELGLSASEAQEADQAKEIMQSLQSALVNMGYKASTVEKVVTLLRPEVEAGQELGQLVRMGLQKLNQTR